MTEERIHAEHFDGGFSGRSFTEKELTAARTLGYARKKYGKWDGSAFWATGEIHLEDIRKLRDAIDVFLPAWEREWDTWRDREKP